MEPSRVIKHIDKSIIERLESGFCFKDIFDYLSQNLTRYKKRDAYIRVSERYLINNWNRIEWKKRMTTMLVIQTSRRSSDIKWIIKNRDKFKKYDDVMLYKLVLLKDKLLFNYELPG